MSGLLRRTGWGWVLAVAGSWGMSAGAQDAAKSAKPAAKATAPGVLPLGADGKPLNLDFETGTLQDWTATGDAFKDQPIKGEIDQNREFGEGKRSRLQGQYWIGGYEKHKDPPRGTLTSAPFKVTHPFAAFRVGGGDFPETRVELVRKDTGRVIFTARGENLEDMLPVVVDLRLHKGHEVVIRLVDDHTGGWGHVNFDDFRFYETQPYFERTGAPSKQDQYAHAGLSPDDAAKAMTLPPSFRAIAFAGEPDVHQPIAQAIDDRGRLWIAEAYEYPNRAPGNKGRDRIVIFEDANNDGKFDKRTTFLEGLNLVSGLELGFGGVWIGAAPYLYFVPDKDGDDKPDGPPQVLLDGWGWQDTHETLNSFTWGPDGWLYGCHGVFTHSRVGKPGTPDKERTPINAGVWRYHPTRHVFEVFASGTSNPWGVDFDDHGNAFITACVIPHLYHMIQGGRYERQGGEHFNKHTYDDIKTIADHRHYVGAHPHGGNNRSDEAGGGHAHAGCLIYLGGVWPERYRGKIFMNNIHGQRINMDILEPQGSGFVGRHGPDFLLTNDSWSQILNLQAGPDGNVYMIDWYDANACHHFNAAGHDRTNGRIFKIVYEGAPNPYAERVKGLDLKKLSDLELAKLVQEKNDWWVRHARRILQERAAERELDPAAITSLTDQTKNHPEPSRRLRALWALVAIENSQQHRTNYAGPDVIDQERWKHLFADSSPYVRGWTLQAWDGVFADSRTVERTRRTKFSNIYPLIKCVEEDDSPIVRRFAASYIQRRSSFIGQVVAERIPLQVSTDAADQNLPLLYWYALEPIAGSKPAAALKLANEGRIPQLLGFTVRRIAALGTPESLATLVDFLEKQDAPDRQLTVLAGLNTALQGRRRVEAPKAFATVYAKLAKSGDARVLSQLRQLAVTFGDAAVQDAMRQVLGDAKADAALRADALASLLKAKDPKLPDLLLPLVGDANLRGPAIRGLAAYDDARTPATLVAAYARLPLTEQRDALATLSARLPYARELIAAVSAKKIPAADLPAELARQLQNFNDPAINRALSDFWGNVRQSPAEKLQLIAQTKAMLATPARTTIDPAHGRAVFAKTCQQCHVLFGVGGKVGPDLTGSNRANLDYLLSNILDPSAVMAKEYMPTLIRTTDGRQLTGIVRTEDQNAVTVQTDRELIVVPKEEIDVRKLSDKSMMPDDLLKPLSETDVRGLVAYLASPRQTSVAATTESVAAFFNGKDLTGWTHDPKLWSIENGEIVGRTGGIKHNDWIKSDLLLGDFHFTCQVKLVKNAGNSGIQFRSEVLPDGEVKGYQADVGVGWWGKLYEEHGRALLWDRSGEKHVRAGEWNKYEIIAVGSRIQTRINDQVCVDIDDPAGARRGIIAFQLHSGGATEVRYKDFAISLAATLPAGGKAVSKAEFPASKPLIAGQKITWKKTTLDQKFRSEGVCAGDFNKDGKLDIAAGNVWFAAPDWKMHPIEEKPETFDPKVYSHSFVNASEDVDRDGWMDVLVVDFPGTPTWWFKNPGAAGGSWKKHMMLPVTNNESPHFVDVDGDGRLEVLSGWLPGKFMGITRRGSDPAQRWTSTALSDGNAAGTDKFSHGLGYGDVNRDGRADVIVTAGWWERPQGAKQGEKQTPWKFHPVNYGPACSQMLVYDFDGDGDNDVLSASAHDFGIWWHEHVDPKAETWKTHVVEKSFSETHATVLADIDGDGLPDFVTGKRWWSHAGGGPGGAMPAVLHWFQLTRQNGKPVWLRHEIDPEQTSGVGTAFEVLDMNTDGLLDIIISNKKGTFYFEQHRE